MSVENLFDMENVFFDKHSSYSFDQLNESLYIENLVIALKEVMDETFYDFEFYIYSEHKSGKLPASADFQTSKKKVLLYFSDETAKDVGQLSGSYFAIFKSYIGELKSAPNVFPLGLGYVKEVPSFTVKDIRDRKYNVFFRGNLNNNRIDFYRAFSKFGWLLPGQRILHAAWYRKILLRLKVDFNSFFESSIVVFNGAFKSGLSPSAYGTLLADSKVILCPRGFSQVECFRHYEAMRAGCVIVSERLPAIYFYENSPIIQVDNWSDGLRQVKQLLSDDEKLVRLQRETVKWWNDICSEKGMATYIANCLEELTVKKV